MIQYILECIVFQLVFLIIHDFFLKRETFFQWNRVYLLTTFAASLVLPWIKIEAFKTDAPALLGYSEYLWNLQPTPIVEVGTVQGAMEITWPLVLFLIGCGMAAIAFVAKLWRLRNLKLAGTVQVYRDHRRIMIPQSYAAFSFLKSIFLGENFSSKETESIVAHELVHIRQWHTLDLLFFEVLRIVFWFNPLVYVYQNRLTELHEFIADAQVPKQERQDHCEMLLSQAFEVQNISFINPFFKSSLTRLTVLGRIIEFGSQYGLVKKRIVMLQKSRSKKIWQLKYLVLVPLVLGMLLYTSCEQNGKNEDQALEGLSLVDRQLIADINEEIDQQIEERSSISNVYLADDLPKRYKALEELSKREFFKYKILYKNYLTDLVTVTYPSMGEDVPEELLIRVKEITWPSTEEYNYYLENLDESYVSKNIFLGENTFPFSSVDEVPVFPGCEDVSDKRACFNEKIMRHISKNFSYPQEAQDRGIQGRVSALFTISKEGNVENIAMRGPDKLLEDEVERILKRLPVMKPGKNKGEEVAVAYSIPVNFKLKDTNEEEARNEIEDFLQVSGALVVDDGTSIFKGKVMDSESMGIPGVNIMVTGSNRAVISEFDGNFSVEASEGQIIEFQYEGLPIKRFIVSK